MSNFILRLIFYFFFTLFLPTLVTAKDSSPNKLGDRVVLSINNIPYTQLQIEAFLLIKEALRADPSNSQIVNASNWDLALNAFIADMVLYQEAIKTNGYRPQKEIVNKVIDKIHATPLQIEKFKVRFQELRMDELFLREQVMRLITIENLRKSRSGAGTGTTPNKERDSWSDDLLKAAIIRWFDQGKIYMNIYPDFKNKSNP